MKSEDVDILWHGKYITVVSPKIAPYEIILEDDGVFVIPIIGEKIGIRKEYCPPYLLKNHDVNELFYTVITGDIDDGETDGEAAVRELKEEAGITILSYKILYYKNYLIAETLLLYASRLSSTIPVPLATQRSGSSAI